MIHRNTKTVQIPLLKITNSDYVKSPEGLIDALGLPKSLLTEIREAHKIFPIRIPRSFINKMEKGNINDPLLKQVLASGDELLTHPLFTNDPVGDKSAEKTPGLLHKYHGRVLLTVTGVCGIHCRYCFRRHFDYSTSNPTQKNWQHCLDYIKNDCSIYEVILSGGDPLSLSDDKLMKLVGDISQIEHVKILRIHTRQIVVAPCRVNKTLLDWILNIHLKCIFVVHCNHPNEIDALTMKALFKLKSVGVQLLNQSVLLKGVNDHPDILEKLSHRLFESGVLPYYLHLLDKVAGAVHFDVSDKKAIEIHERLKQRLPGYLTPKLVRENQGAPYKTPITQ